MSKIEKREYNNLSMTVPVFDIGKNMRSVYNYEEVDEIFNSVPFDKIPVAINAYKNEYYNDISKIGSMPVGFITGYDSENHMFDVVIMEKYADRINEYDSIMVYPRVRVVGGKVVKVLGLDICSESYYANLFNS